MMGTWKDDQQQQQLMAGQSSLDLLVELHLVLFH